MGAVTEIIDIDIGRHASEISELWQARALREAKGTLGAVLLSVLAHNYDDAMPVLLRVVFPGFQSIAAPFLCSAGKIAKNGTVCADVVTKDGQLMRMARLYPSTKWLERDFRKLGDRVKLSDADRTEMFAALHNWLVCDFRIDPSMNPVDPDAKRLTVH